MPSLADCRNQCQPACICICVCQHTWSMHTWCIGSAIPYSVGSKHSFRQTGPCLMRFGGHDDLSLEGMTSGAKHPPSCCLPVCSELRHLTAKPVHARRVLKTPLPCRDNDSVDIAYASAHRHTLNAQLQMHMTDRGALVLCWLTWCAMNTNGIDQYQYHQARRTLGHTSRMAMLPRGNAVHVAMKTRVNI